MCGGSKIKSAKTNVVTRTDEDEMIYNKTFNFVVPHAFLEDTSLVISLCIKGKLKQDHVIGRSVSGPITVASNDKITHWGRMFVDCSR